MLLQSVSSVDAMALERLLAVLVVSCIAVCILADEDNLQWKEQVRKLRSDLFNTTKYDPWIKPVKNATNDVKVDMHLRLVRAPTLDPEKHLFEATAVLCMLWDDVHLVWNYSQYGGLNRLLLNKDEAWWPRLLDVNPRNAPTHHTSLEGFVAFSNGKVQYCRPSALRTVCITDLSDFPYDKHECMVSYHAVADITTGSCTAEMASSNRKAEFEVINATAGPVLVQSQLGDWRIEIRFNFVLQRRNQMYRYTVVAPAVAASILSLLVFWLPPGSGRKLTVPGVSLAVAVATMYASLHVVSGSIQVPKIAKILGALSLIDSVIILTAVLGTNMARRSTNSSHRPPSFLAKFPETFFGRLLCLCPPAFSEHEPAGFEGNKEWYLVAQAMDRVLFVVLLAVFVGITC